MRKVRTEKARNEFVFRTSRIVNRLEPYIHFDKGIGLKTRILNTMWKVEKTPGEVLEKSFREDAGTKNPNSSAVNPQQQQQQQQQGPNHRGGRVIRNAEAFRTPVNSFLN